MMGFLQCAIFFLRSEMSERSLSEDTSSSVAAFRFGIGTMSGER